VCVCCAHLARAGGGREASYKSNCSRCPVHQNKCTLSSNSMASVHLVRAGGGRGAS
jgi:hypothetical protein